MHVDAVLNMWADICFVKDIKGFFSSIFKCLSSSSKILHCFSIGFLALNPSLMGRYSNSQILLTCSLYSIERLSLYSLVFICSSV